MKRRDFLRTSLQVGMTAALQRHLGAAPKKDAPNVLWIMMDDARPDALSCYGKPWAKTPNMDAIAAAGAQFDTAVVQCPICVPSRTSMKTGLYCHRFGLMSMGKAPEIQTPYSYQNGAGDNMLRGWNHDGHRPINVGKTHAFQKDWETWGDPPPVRPPRPDTGGMAYPSVNLTTHGWKIGGTIDCHPDDTRAGQIAGHAIKSLEKLGGDAEPYFMRVSFHAPHVPIEVPKSFMIDPDSVDLPYPSQAELDSKPKLEREQLRVYAGTTDLTHEQIQIARGTYYGMVSLVDHHVGRLLDAMRSQGLLENTIVVVNSDHGLQMGEHGLHKKRNFYEETIKSPMLISWPGVIPEGRRIEEMIEMVDLLPTLLDLSGMEVPANIDGRSMSALLSDSNAKGRDAVFAEIDQSGSMYDELRHDSGRRVMVRTRDWKMEYNKDPRVSDPDGSLYDLNSDPSEKVNLFEDGDSLPARSMLEGLVDAWDETVG